ncbi:MAG TPA: energy transducer TonB [Pyrinomonadaceae bacterium]|nr:energy transducer TonB [Pyrinomonadaceae bacterium]
MKRIAAICMVILVGLVSLSVAQEAPREIKGGILNGKATSLPRPEYPAEARAARLEGTVLVDVVVDESGVVTSAVAATDVRKTRWVRGDESGETEVGPADPMLREAAEKAAIEARFSPTTLSGVPVRVSGIITYSFVLEEKPAIIDGAVLNSKALSLPLPAYPAAAKAVRASGTVAVKVTVDEEGNVISAVAASGHPLLRSAAVDAAREAKFSPSLLSGQPAKASGILIYNFVP